jgi:hypothetical protein
VAQPESGHEGAPRPGAPEPALDAYLSALDAALAGVSAAERRDILLETRSHVLERTARAPGRPVGAVLAELGPPDAYARQFLTTAAAPGDADAHGGADTDGSPRPRGSATLRALAELTGRGWRAVPLLVAVAVAYGLAGLLLLFVLGEVVDPAATGIFVRDRPGRPAAINVVISGYGNLGRDVLGRALLPLLLLLIAAIHLAVLAVVRRAAARAFRPTSPAVPASRRS